MSYGRTSCWIIVEAPREGEDAGEEDDSAERDLSSESVWATVDAETIDDLRAERGVRRVGRSDENRSGRLEWQ